MSTYSAQTKMAYAVYKLEDTLERLKASPDEDFTDIAENKESVISRYQMVFSPERIRRLTKDEFLDFLIYHNNHHWTNLCRVGKFMVEDMDSLRYALSILVDESMDVETRLTLIRPERRLNTKALVSHLGTPVLTAILMIMHPDRYGVWNNTSEAGLKAVRLWERRWNKCPTGKAYVEMNAVYRELSAMLKIDLWTLDALWWMVKRGN